MAYSKTTWVNGTTPAISAANLNKMEDGIYDVTESTISLKKDVNDVSSWAEHYNLINPSKLTVGYLSSSSGAISSSDSYKTTDFIPIKSGQSVICTPRVRFFLAYDSNKNAISATYISENQENYVFTASQNGYIRATLYNSTVGVSACINYGTTAISYRPYSDVKLSQEVHFGSEQISEINNLIDAKLPNTEDWFENEKSVNLFDYSKGVYGIINGLNNIDLTNTNYEISDYIPVEKNVKYAIKKAVGATGRIRYLLYNSSKVNLTYGDYSNVETVNFTPSANGYIRVCTNKGEAFEKMMVVVGESAPANYVPFYELIIPNSTIEADNILWGKKWVVCGDSFTFGSESDAIEEGKYIGENIVYPYLIGNRNNMDIIRFFKSGQTLAFPAIPGAFTNSLTCSTNALYYQNIPEDADYITIYLGINDEHHYTGGGDGEDPTGTITLGTIDDETTDTYYGAWNVVLTWLITNRPFAHIGIIITNGLSISDWYQAQVNIAQKYGIPYIDLNGSVETPVMIRSMNPNISSAVKTIVNQKQAVDYTGERTGTVNLHPNDNAHIYESVFIENFLRSI